MPAKTVIALLNEANKLSVYEMKTQIKVASYPYMQEDDQKEFMKSLLLPEDVLSDIIIVETSETDKQKFKEALDGD